MAAATALARATRATPKASPLAAAKRVLLAEADALKRLALSCGDAMLRALDLMEASSGRIIVSGMGKSGHVGRKIAATLASTGAPAQFVHPAEAGHGDLGMIAEGDVVLALSNSGETEELYAVVAYSRRFSIPLIVMTGRPQSALAQAADVALLLPDVAEACPLGLAPTTSTTMMMAYGDALALALLTRKGFSAEDFGTYHPGGKLGAKLRRVRDIMHGGKATPLAALDMTMDKALLRMTAGRFGCLGIVDGDGRLKGVITDGDLRRHMSPTLLSARADRVMTPNPLTIHQRKLVSDAMTLMNGRGVTNLFVVGDDAGIPVGIVHIHDCLRAGAL